MIVIIAPHPDDEWIGCGCTILNNLEGGVKVLLITRVPGSENRVKVSQDLAKQYGYQLKILGEPEKNINILKLTNFIKSNVGSSDIVYVPDSDTHPDHIKITEITQECLPNNVKYQYCVYNNSNNILRRVYTKLTGGPSFKTGKKGFREDNSKEEKDENILKYGEVKRGGDVLRLL